MRRLPRFPLLLLLLSLPFAAATAAAPAPTAPATPEITGSLETVSGIPVLRLWGTPHDRGFAQGYLLAKEIVTGTDRGLSGFLRDRMDAYAQKILPVAGMGFRFSDAEIAEMEGIVEGIRARLPEEEDRVVGCLGRELALADVKVLNTFGDWYALGCSSVALWGEKTEDGTPAVVRNFDFLAFDLVAAHQHLRVVLPPPGDAETRGWVGVCHPGSVGALTAMSSEGVFAAIHDVPVLGGMKDVLQGNVPRLLAIRRLVEGLPAEGAVEKAVERCRSWNTLYGNNFLVATPEPGDGLPAGVLEYDTREDDDRGVDLRGPGENPEGQPLPFVLCSNHFRIRGNGTCPRYDRLLVGAGEAKGPMSVDDLFALATLAAVPGPKGKISDRRFGTLHQVVALTGARKFWVRMAKSDGNIRDSEPAEFDVTALLADLAKRAAK